MPNAISSIPSSAACKNDIYSEEWNDRSCASVAMSGVTTLKTDRTHVTVKVGRLRRHKCDSCFA